MERNFEDEQYQMRMHEQGYTQSDMEEFDGLAMEKKNFVPKRGVTTNVRSYSPIKEEAATQ